ncbi:MAG: hypothetical protein M3R14_00955 [Acidobacteriota bacterium]|nr:hypothetical protein [Acidobacteriota bacterium]
MAKLKSDEIRRLTAHLKKRTNDAEQFNFIEDELRGEEATEFIREPEILSYFTESEIEIDFEETKWILKMIRYTHLRMIQRGISRDTIIKLFKRFIELCRKNNEVITVGAYTIFGKSDSQSKSITLRIDVDDVSDKKGKAHTVTVFVGSGNVEDAFFIAPEQ